MSPFHSTRAEDTEALARSLAEAAQPGDVFCLSGPLGAGKSVFARGFIRALCGADTDVPSPTFTLVQTYEGRTGPIAHFDLYRLDAAEEVLDLDWDDAMAESICLIEWPDKAGGFLPRRRIDVVFEPQTDESRTILVNRHDR